MRIYGLFFCGLSLVVGACGHRGGDGNFDIPAKAKSVQGYLVRAYARCESGAANTTTAAGAPACTPAQPRSTYNFGSKGACKFKAQLVTDPDCESCLAPEGYGPCNDVRVKIECKDIRTSSGDLIPDEDVWAVTAVTRQTGTDQTTGEMTGIDFPSGWSFLNFDFGGTSDAPGRLSLSWSANRLASDLFGPCSPQLGDYNLELVGSGADGDELSSPVIEIRDPIGGRFASLGGGLGSETCTLDAPAKAQGFKGSLTRAYSSCPGVTFTSPNTTTFEGIPGCSPPTPISTYLFGPKGQCKLSTKHGVAKDCGGLSGTICQDINLNVQCSDILNQDGVTPIDNSGWILRLVTRVTMQPDGSPDFTVVDTPVDLAFGDANDGKLRLRVSSSDTAFGSLGAGADIPACSSVEIFTVQLRDPTGAIFARLGGAFQWTP